MPLLAAKVGERMPPVIDDESLKRFRVDEKPRMTKRNYYTEPERLALIDAAVKEHGFRSFNKFMDAASEWFIAALREKEAAKRKGAKK